MNEGEAPESEPAPDDDEAAGNEPDDLDELLAGLEEILQSGDAEEIDELPAPDLPSRDLEQDIRLKRIYANWLLGLLIGQLLIADGVFVVYAWAGRGWNLEAGVINGWLAATLIEIVGIVLVVARYLFPRRDVSPGD
jgi:hypothetical protein